MLSGGDDRSQVGGSERANCLEKPGQHERRSRDISGRMEGQEYGRMKGFAISLKTMEKLEKLNSVR